MVLEEIGNDERCAESDRGSAGGSSSRERKIESGQVLRSRLRPRQLPMSHPAQEKERRDERDDAGHELLRIFERPARSAEARDEERRHDPPRVEAAPGESEHVGQEVRDERHDPQERHRRDVEAKHVRRRDQERRGPRRERDPEKAIGGRGSRAFHLGRAPRLPPRTPCRREGRAGREQRKSGEPPRPCVGLPPRAIGSARPRPGRRAAQASRRGSTPRRGGRPETRGPPGRSRIGRAARSRRGRRTGGRSSP